MALVCYNDWEIDQMDVDTAFLNADVESDIYMGEPQGFGSTDADGPRLVCHLKKALYGIREATKAWNALLTSWLISYGFTQSLVDPRVFVLFVDKLIYILVVNVDDSILTGKAEKFFTDFKTSFSARFKIEDLGPAYWLLGCRIDRHRDEQGSSIQLGAVCLRDYRGVWHGILYTCKNTNGSQGSLQAMTREAHEHQVVPLSYTHWKAALLL